MKATRPSSCPADRARISAARLRIVLDRRASRSYEIIPPCQELSWSMVRGKWKRHKVEISMFITQKCMLQIKVSARLQWSEFFSVWVNSQLDVHFILLHDRLTQYDAQVKKKSNNKIKLKVILLGGESINHVMPQLPHYHSTNQLIQSVWYFQMYHMAHLLSSLLWLPSNMISLHKIELT